MTNGRRRLAAIMFTDLAGYSSHAQRDEAGALALLDAQDRLVRPVLAAHRGRRIKSMGDGLLVEFPNALAAVECAVDLQRRAHERNAGANGPPLRLRIGIHLGDVERRGTDILGDAVNVAARIEPLAEPGGVCLSAQVYDQVRNKVPYQLETLGSQRLKGLADPVVVYRVRLPWLGRDGPPPPGGFPRLAVLPLANISPDPKDEYFADGLTEELIATLSQIRGLRVIARTSVLPYKAASKPASQIGKELGVSSLLEGSVRKAGDALRVTAQLVDVGTEEPLWSTTYDRRLENVFAIQQELAQRIAESLQVQLLAGDRERLVKKPTENLEAYEAYLHARQLWAESADQGLLAALPQFERAVELDPDFALAYCGLAETHALLGNRGLTPLPPALEKAEKAARTALRLDPDLSEAHVALAPVLYNRYDWRGAEVELNRALDLDPGNVQAHFWRAIVVGVLGRPADGVENARRAVELDPLVPGRRIGLAQQYYWLRRYDRAIAVLAEEGAAAAAGAHRVRGYAYLLLGRPESAVAELEAAVSEMRRYGPNALAELAAVYGRVGRAEEARAIVRELIDRRARENVPAGSVGWVYVGLGELDAAFEWFDRAHAEGSARIVEDLNVDPFMDPLRADPRFPALLARFHFPPVLG